jgi:hypothetical protein
VIAATVPFALIRDFIEALGADVNDVQDIMIDPDGVTVTSWRRDAKGALVAANRRPATVTTVVGIEPQSGAS